MIRQSGEELLAVLNDVLDLSKIEAGKLELEVGETSTLEAWRQIVRDAFAPLAEAKKGLRLQRRRCGPRPPGWWRGDAVRLRQILNNLVSNAIKFTAEGEVNVVVDGIGRDGARRA